MRADARPLVARRIQEIREAKKVSRADLAERVDAQPGNEVTWTRMRVWRLENDAIEVSADDVRRIAEALGASVASFYREARAA